VLLYDLPLRLNPWPTKEQLQKMAKEDTLNKFMYRETMELLGKFPLNAAYLQVEAYDDMCFEVDLEAILLERVRVGRGLGVNEDEVVYSIVRPRFVYSWRPFKVVEYSYRV